MTQTIPHPEPPISAHADPLGEAPWAMQLVVLVDKSTPPTRTDVCTAAARAVLAVLSHPNAAPGGTWHAAIERWLDGRIRKHVRRARGAAWVKVQELEGVTVTAGTAQVRAFVPSATDQIPRDIARLQLSGSELDDPTPLREVDVRADGPVVVSLTPVPHPLGVGKAAAAAGHAVQLASMDMEPARLQRWLAAGAPVLVEQPAPDLWAQRRLEADVAVIDAGLTEVEPGTCTALARWR